jgi:hypothetical protein
MLRVLVVCTVLVGCTAPVDSSSPGPASAIPTTAVTPVAASVAPSAVPATSAAPPTGEPEPTPAVTSPPRAEIEINGKIVDRAGVPGELRDNYWWQGSDVGLLGTTAQLGLPSAESVMHAANGLVVSSRARSDGEQGTELVVRRFETGSVLGEVHTLQVLVVARIVGRRLFWTGMRGGESCPAGPNIDGGVWAMDLLAGSAPVAIVEPGRVMECGFGGRGLLLSPSGSTLGAAMLFSPYWIDVIDVARLVRTHRVRDQVWPRAITDDTWVQWDHPPTDGLDFGLGGLTAYDLDDGAARWAFPGDDEVEQFGHGRTLALGSQFFIQYAWNNTPDEPRSNAEVDLVLATFDPLTGQRRELLRQRDTPEDDDLARIEGDLSSDSHVTLRLGDDPIGIDGRSFAVLDVAAGTVTWDAFSIDPPWLCWSDGCFRDS